MRASQIFRWWVFLPLLLVLLVPAWGQLGGWLGYDVIPAPDPAPPRYSSRWLGSIFYIIWFGLMFVAILPSMIVMFPFSAVFPDEVRMWCGLVLVSLIYTCVFILISWAKAAARLPADGKLVSRANDA